MKSITDAEAVDLLFQHFARIGHALSSPHRLVLLYLLSQGERSVEVLADTANYPVKNTSAHLRALREARLVQTRKQGTHVIYRLAGEEVARFLAEVFRLGRALLVEADQLAREHFEGDDAGVSAAEVARLLEAGEVQLVDLRPGEEHAEGHVPGALSIPFSRLAERMEELSREREVVVYCRGAYCTHGTDAVALLVGRGHRARRLREGFFGWRAAGSPVESRECSRVGKF